MTLHAIELTNQASIVPDHLSGRYAEEFDSIKKPKGGWFCPQKPEPTLPPNVVILTK